MLVQSLAATTALTLLTLTAGAGADTADAAILVAVPASTCSGCEYAEVSRVHDNTLTNASNCNEPSLIISEVLTENGACYIPEGQNRCQEDYPCSVTINGTLQFPAGNPCPGSGTLYLTETGGQQAQRVVDTIDVSASQDGECEGPTDAVASITASTAASGGDALSFTLRFNCKACK